MNAAFFVPKSAGLSHLGQRWDKSEFPQTQAGRPLQRGWDKWDNFFRTLGSSRAHMRAQGGENLSHLSQVAREPLLALGSDGAAIGTSVIPRCPRPSQICPTDADAEVKTGTVVTGWRREYGNWDREGPFRACAREEL